jgi:Ni/Co efflux regulator RcnB
MKSKLSLMTALVGLAMLATPLTAAAKDHGREARNYSHAAPVARTFAPAVVNRHEVRNGGNGMWMPAPRAIARHEWHEDRHEWKHGWGDADDYRNYGGGYGGYNPAPVYAAPVYAAPVYSGYGGYGRNCLNAQRVMNTYWRDRNTGHPAAAYDLLRQNQWAFHSGCASGAPVGNRLLGGFTGYGTPAYGNYGGYGQPYGGSSLLGPLLQYVR